MADDSRAQAGVELLKSLEAVIKTVTNEEVKSLREAIKSTEAGLLQRIVQSENSNSRAIEILRSDVNSRVEDALKRLDALEQNYARLKKEVESRIATSASLLEEKTQKRIAEIQATISSSLHQHISPEIAAVRENIEREVESLRQELRTATAQLELHAAELQRVSTVLSGFARIFSTEAPPTPPAQSISPPPATTPTQTKKKGITADTPRTGSPPPQQLRSSRPNDISERKSTEDEPPALPTSGDIVESIDSIFKLKPDSK